MEKVIKFSDYKKHTIGSSRRRHYNPERWIPVAERTILSPKHAPSTEYMYMSFVREIKTLARKGQIDLSMFPEYWDIDIKLKNYQLPTLALDEISMLSYDTQIEVILDMLTAIHDGWVKDNAPDFFGYYMGWEFLFLPIELAGENVLRLHYDVVKKRLEKLGMPQVEWEMIYEAYQRRQKNYRDRYKVEKKSDLINMITFVGRHYKPLGEDVAAAISLRSQAFTIANQVLYRNPSFVI